MSTTVTSSPRPVLHEPDLDAQAEEPVRQLIAHLQGGLDHGDADEYDRPFAADVLWGSPYGRTLAGYAELNAIHHILMRRQIAGRSRYEAVQTIMPTPDVVVT